MTLMEMLAVPGLDNSRMIIKKQKEVRSQIQRNVQNQRMVAALMSVSSRSRRHKS